MGALDPPRTRARVATERVLLACGVLYALTYVLSNDLVAATVYRGYSRMDQAISELSATTAPTRAFLTAMLPVETALILGFGIGVWRVANGNRALRVTGGLLVGAAVVGVAWLPFPMTSRDEMVRGAIPASDVGHIVLTVVTILFIVAIITVGALAIRSRVFRLYSAVTLVAVLGFGALTGVQAAKVQEGLPTPWMGLFERINAYGYMLWLAVFALVLQRRP